MLNKKNEKVYGLLGIESKMANWNADFSGFARTTGDGTVFGTDKAIKYGIRNYWNQNEDNKLLCFKEYMEVFPENKKDKEVLGSYLQPMTLLEKYKKDFNVIESLKKLNQTDILVNLLSYTDVKNFGITFAVDECNLSITGPVQFGHGFDIMGDVEQVQMQITSPFRNSNDKSKGNMATTIGNQTVTKEAHYLYSVIVNPLAYQKEMEHLKNKKDIDESLLYYTKEDYAKLKGAMLLSATSLDSCAKKGANNEFALFLETENDTYLPDLSCYVKFKKEDKNIYEINFEGLLEDLGKSLKTIEIFYNNASVEIKGDVLASIKTKIYNIFTQKEIVR